MKIAPAFAASESALARIGSFLQPLLLLIVRVYWGWAFAQTGWGKLMNLERTTNFFASLGIPAANINAMAAGSTECVGGILLALGLYTRFATPALIATMITAYSLADREALFAIFTDGEKFTQAAPFLYLFSALIVFAFGPGMLSLDAWLRKKMDRSAPLPATPSGRHERIKL